jgi:two-component system, chemotaxis family, CheB/CheR fusion protein
MALILNANADHRFSQILSKVLISNGHEVVTARTSAEALQQCESKSPSLVLLDLGLPGLSGIDVLARLRARSPHLPVLIVTSNISPDVERQAREMGVVEVIRERLNLHVIVQAVHRTLEHADRPPKAAPVAKISTLQDGRSLKKERPRTILVVDDDEPVAKLLAEYLARRGYRTQTALSGEAALASVKQAPPDLVLLDVYMPGINGVEVLRYLRNAHPAVGVIMLTASQEEPLLQTALDLGAFDVLCKPVDLAQVELAVMVKLLLSTPD